MMRMTYAVKSVCPCGYTTLNDDIPLGKVYEVDETEIEPQIYGCGGCNRIQYLRAIKTKNADGSWGWLPLRLFGEVQKGSEATN